MLYATLCAISFATLNCSYAIAGKSFMVEDSTIRCDSVSYVTMRMAAIISTGMLVVVLPALFAAVICSNRRIIRSSDPEGEAGEKYKTVCLAYGFLFEGASAAVPVGTRGVVTCLPP